jgi:hypothetical protein
MSDEFPNDQWPELKRLMDGDGAPAVIEFIAGHDDLLARRKLYLFAAGAFGREEWARDMDAFLEVAHAGINESLDQAKAEADAEIRDRRINLANVIAYNAGSTLADCWEGTGAALDRRHFKAGLALAERCLAWRETNGKGANPFSKAWWL